MTEQEQGFDISDNKMFKETLRKNYEAWLLTENLPPIPAIKTQKHQ